MEKKSTTKGTMIFDGGVFPSNSGQRKGSFGKNKQISTSDVSASPIKGPTVPASGAGDLNTPENNKVNNYW